MNRIARSILLGVLISLVFVAPALAQYFAYLVVEESNGVSYNNLPLTCFRNITQLVDYDIITSSGLDTRVLTGDVETLPHMLAEDRIMFVTDLEADEEKTLIFYTGAVSLSDFPIIVGYNGSIITPDDPDLELTYVMELLASGYFDASSGSNKNILYKEDAFKMSISAANTLRVAALEAGDVEQWEMHYSPFTSGEHTIYVMANGLVAYLYVDNFEVAKDTANLFDSTSYQCINKEITPRCFYDEGYYWVFYYYDSTNFAYVTSADGVSWSGETLIPIDGGDGFTAATFDIKMRGAYIHFVYADGTGTNYLKYRRGDLTSVPDITWSAGWQQAATDVDSGHSYSDPWIAIDTQQYPYIAWQDYKGADYGYCTKSANNDGTWSTAGGYPWQVWSLGANNGIFQGFVGYPSSDKLLLLWEKHGYDTWWDNTYCNYYNGSSWEPVDDISSLIGDIGAATLAADDDDNMYIGWCSALGIGGDDPNQYLTVRYDGEVWEDPAILINADGDYSPWLCYNENNGVLYILYGYRDGSDWVYCVTLDTNEMEPNIPVQIMALLADGPIRGVNPYEDRIGFIQNDTNAYHGLIDLSAYVWNDNSNNWTWMQNNVMPYADYFVMAIDGTTHLQYQPDTIIEGDTLPDVSGASGNDGIINWGANPSGVNTTLYVLHPETGEETIPPVVLPGEASSSDVVGPTGQQGWTSGLPVLASNPLYPLIYVIATETKIPLGIVWILCATFLLILAMFLCVRYVPHLIFTALVGGGLSAFFYAIGIYPFWVIFIFAVMALAIIIGERSPTV